MRLLGQLQVNRNLHTFWFSFYLRSPSLYLSLLLSLPVTSVLLEVMLTPNYAYQLYCSAHIHMHTPVSECVCVCASICACMCLCVRLCVCTTVHAHYSNIYRKFCIFYALISWHTNCLPFPFPISFSACHALLSASGQSTCHDNYKPCQS